MTVHLQTCFEKESQIFSKYQLYNVCLYYWKGSSAKKRGSTEYSIQETEHNFVPAINTNELMKSVDHQYYWSKVLLELTIRGFKFYVRLVQGHAHIFDTEKDLVPTLKSILVSSPVGMCVC